MAKPFQPEFFKDFYDKYPSDRELVKELEKDMWEQREMKHLNMQRYTFFAVAPIFLYTLVRGPLPIFAKYGRFLGTHRTFRQYSYAACFSLGLAEYEFRSKYNRTLQKLNEIDADRTRRGEIYIEPTKPIAYTFKHY